MSDDKKTATAALGAAISMLGLSLGVATPAEAQAVPPAAGGQAGTQGILIGLNQPRSEQQKGTQGVLIGLNQPSAQQWKSEQYKSQQYKSEQLKSQQLKSQQIKLRSQQIKQPGQ
ncbi:hypothetical protein BH10PSE14_BH10PSE14_43170 [soil metagenome]